ncbi:hypothetical protein PSCICF_20960 [Pseudomonas cichorii]|nr:hypothetical protein [Pseudomonas cichorii]MBX8606428.1 hypothetical protein [Pseudomonas cichorii]GFM55918.1 hypothetical protein PSCICF_20960 [Pseudomonas cichorii]GFM60161.1 hypothetical protein PSCICG_13210 [Pseudomonas cichorii]
MPATTLSLTSLVRRRLLPLWPTLDDEHAAEPGVKAILENLGELGDLVRLDGGHWLTPPPQAIRTGGPLAVITGGGPTQTFPWSITMRGAGRLRLIDVDTCAGRIDLWEAQEWIGAPLEGLQEWSIQLFTNAKAQLKPAPSELTDVSIRSSGKWVALSACATAEGLFLAKCRTGPRFEYCVVQVSQGHLRQMKGLRREESRRLQFYVDAQAGHPLKVRADVSQSEVRLCLNRHLPREEARALLLGWQLPPPGGGVTTATNYVIPREMFPLVRQALTGLSVDLTERELAEGRP